MFDCIVVGAGPAGGSAAYHLANRGYSVLILDKAAFPRYKPCSGALSPIVANWFDVDFEPAIERKIRRVRYTWKLDDEIVSELQTQEPIWVVKRDVFDSFLVSQAIARGAVLKDDTPATGIEFQGDAWTVQTPAELFQGRYLVAADGATGPMASWLGFKDHALRQGAVLTVPASVPVTESCAFNFEFGLLKNGCLWCLPQQTGYVIGGVAPLAKRDPGYRSVLEDYAADFDPHYRQGTHYTHALKWWNGNRMLHRPQAVIVGEAAALVDPLSSEGIRHGMYSGVKAAEAIHQALAGDAEALAGYTETMHAWGDDIQWAQRIASVFFRVPGIGYRVGIKRPSMTTRMGQLLTGEVRYSDIAGRVIKRMTTGFLPGSG